MKSNIIIYFNDFKQIYENLLNDAEHEYSNNYRNGLINEFKFGENNYHDQYQMNSDYNIVKLILPNVINNQNSILIFIPEKYLNVI